MFSVGEKVVCIDVFNTEGRCNSHLEKCPVKGEMYTIRTIEEVEDGISFRLQEIINPQLMYEEGVGECQFASTGFRKLDHGFAEEVIANLKENEKVKTNRSS